MESDGKACAEASAVKQAPREFGHDGEAWGGFGQGAQRAVGPAAEEVAGDLAEEESEGDDGNVAPLPEPAAEHHGHGEATENEARGAAGVAAEGHPADSPGD